MLTGLLMFLLTLVALVAGFYIVVGMIWKKIKATFRSWCGLGEPVKGHSRAR